MHSMEEENAFWGSHAKMVHGELRELSDSRFVWTIYDFNLNKGTTFSEDFRYMENTYCLQMKLCTSCSADSGYLMGYRIDSYHFDVPTYTLRIEDKNGDYFGPFYYKDYGKFYYFDTGYMSFLSTDDFFEFYLQFGPRTTGQPPTPEVISAGGTVISPTVVGTQTCWDLQSASSSSYSSEGLDIINNFKRLLLSGQASDVTFNVKETEIKAHKTFLIAHSDVFDKMFNDEMLEKTSGTVRITDCEPDAFYAFLLYMYTGRVEIPTVERAVELYCLADKYNVEALGRYCVQFLLSNWSVESFFDILSLGLRHGETDLLDSASSFLHENMKQIVCLPKWKAFNKENPDEATEILMKAISKSNY